MLFVVDQFPRATMFCGDTYVRIVLAHALSKVERGTGVVMPRGPAAKNVNPASTVSRTGGIADQPPRHAKKEVSGSEPEESRGEVQNRRGVK